ADRAAARYPPGPGAGNAPTSARGDRCWATVEPDGEARALAADATHAPQALPNRTAAAAGPPASLLPGRPGPLRRPLERARRGQLRRERIQQAAEQQHQRSARTDAVH